MQLCEQICTVVKSLPVTQNAIISWCWRGLREKFSPLPKMKLEDEERQTRWHGRDDIEML